MSEPKLPNEPRSGCGENASGILSWFVRFAKPTLMPSVSTFADPVLPLLLLGVIAAALILFGVFDLPPEFVCMILLIGGLTAVIETKMHNDRRDG